MPLFGGKTKKPKSYINSIDVDQDPIYAGQRFTGRVNVLAGRSPLFISQLQIQLIGIAKSKYVIMKSNTNWWEEEKGDTRQRMYCSEVYTISNRQLPKGDHDIEFSLTAPKICPSSLEETSNYFVRYYLRVHLLLNDNTKEKQKKSVKVVGACNVSGRPSYFCANQWIRITNLKEKFAPGDRVELSFDNKSQSSLKAQLMQQVTATHIDHKIYKHRCEDELCVKTFTNKLATAEFGAEDTTGWIGIPTDAAISFLHDPDPQIHPVQVYNFILFKKEGTTWNIAELPILIGIDTRNAEPPSYEDTMGQFEHTLRL